MSTEITLGSTLKVIELRPEAPSQYFDYVGMTGTVMGIEHIAEETMYQVDFFSGSKYPNPSFFTDEVVLWENK